MIWVSIQPDKNSTGIPEEAVEDIDGERGVIRILNGKGGKIREVPIDKEMLQRLRNFWRAHRNPERLLPGAVSAWRDGWRPPQSPQGMSVDKDYSREEIFRLLDEFGFTPHIGACGEKAQASKGRARKNHSAGWWSAGTVGSTVSRIF